jgi:ubiquinone/menaquinone biosynthesis C-methylase UbiE
LDDPLRQAKAKAAATYDAAVDHFDDEPLTFWDRIGRQTVERLALSLSAQVLDVGCGTGASALPAAQAVGPSGRVVGVDLSARLTRQGGRARLTNVEFRIGDMTSSGYPDQSFDAVISVFSVFFVPDVEGLVRELWRIVRRGGKLVVTTRGPRIFEPPIHVGRRRSSGNGRIFTAHSTPGIALPTSNRFDICSTTAASPIAKWRRKMVFDAARG